MFDFGNNFQSAEILPIRVMIKSNRFYRFDDTVSNLRFVAFGDFCTLKMSQNYRELEYKQFSNACHSRYLCILRMCKVIMIKQSVENQNVRECVNGAIVFVLYYFR